MRHELKILPQHFTPVLDEIKTAELRKNDRNFAVGDMLLLMEWNGDYTGDACERVVTHVADVGDCLPGYVLLSMTPPQPTTDTYRQIENDGWIEWKAGHMPESVRGERVQVRYAGGETETDSSGFLNWGYGAGQLVIAYRVIENDGREG
ncbi:DUF3850 domain-containing protein [Pantoea sp. S18]|uniref:DUF3850 domain-containing protein n=1 Tax=Pantoea sp. S18 TaxID=3019892 RepID=UPI002B218DF0|nr:DUF3850 domain-containing protein [Pantoea sp. S18]MEA5104712.1 DUF3850 domain-containing protein [Pantoea sp. S18]